MKDKQTVIGLLRDLDRKFNEINKTLDLISHDREILEEILSRMTGVETALKIQRSTATENAKNIKADIGDVKDAVEAKVDEVAEIIDDKTVIMKSSKDSIIQKVMDKITKK